MADYKPNTCETCDRYDLDFDSPGKLCWRCSINTGHYTNIPEPIENFWKSTEWFEAYQQLEDQLAAVESQVKIFNGLLVNREREIVEQKGQLAAAQHEAESKDRHATGLATMLRETEAKLDVAETARKRNLEQLEAATADKERYSRIIDAKEEWALSLDKRLDAMKHERDALDTKLASVREETRCCEDSQDAAREAEARLAKALAMTQEHKKAWIKNFVYPSVDEFLDEMAEVLRGGKEGES
jgi:chromosome segregation ATPase